MNFSFQNVLLHNEFVFNYHLGVVQTELQNFKTEMKNCFENFLKDFIKAKENNVAAGRLAVQFPFKSPEDFKIFEKKLENKSDLEKFVSRHYKTIKFKIIFLRYYKNWTNILFLCYLILKTTLL